MHNSGWMNDEPVTFCPSVVHSYYPSSPLTLEILNCTQAGTTLSNQKGLGPSSGSVSYVGLPISYSVYVSQGWSQTWWLKTTKFISNFWRSDVQNPGLSRGMLPSSSSRGESVSWFFQLLVADSTTWLVAVSLQGQHLQISLWSFFTLQSPLRVVKSHPASLLQ